MKKIILPILTAILFASSSCVKDTCKDVITAAPASEVAILDAYITSNSIAATKDTRGFYFKINTTGANTDHPTICSNVVVKYKGTLTNGTKFDENTTGISFPLSNLIIGWQEGIPLISIGGKITLYLPPSLGYGAVAQQNIPANSILIFDIELVSF